MKSILVIFLLLWFAFCGTAAEEDNLVDVVVTPLYTKYTVRDGELALAGVKVLGYPSIEAFQSSNGLTEDGVVGHETSRVLERRLADRGVSFGASSPDPISVNVEMIGSNYLALVISNRLDRPIRLSGSAARGPQEFEIAVSCAVTGTRTNQVSFKGGSRIGVRWPTGITVMQHTNVQRLIEFQRVGHGTSIARCEFVIICDQRSVSRVKSGPTSIAGALKLISNTDAQ